MATLPKKLSLCPVEGIEVGLIEAVPEQIPSCEYAIQHWVVPQSSSSIILMILSIGIGYDNAVVLESKAILQCLLRG